MVDSGSAYVFRRNGSSWVAEQELLPEDRAAGDHFGAPVSVSGDVVVVGARLDDDNGTNSGSAYVFTLTCGNGVVDLGEQCDDGNNDDGDGCSFDCLFGSGGVPILPHEGLILFAALLLGTSIWMIQRRLRFQT
jgi:cysteine-rich repeat protein